MSPHDSIESVDAFFTELGREEEGMPDRQHVRGEIEKTLNPVRLTWNSGHNLSYPGGTESLRQTYEPLVLDVSKKAQELFGVDDIGELSIEWHESEPNGFKGASVGFNILTQPHFHNGILQGFSSKTSAAHTLSFFGSEKTPKHLEHEFGHVLFYPSLPNYLPIQEAAACACEAILRGGDMLTGSLQLLKPTVLYGDSGWGMSEFGQMDFDNCSSIIAYAGFFHALLDAANGDIERLQKILAWNRAQWRAENGTQEPSEMTSLGTWLEHIACFDPAFADNVRTGDMMKPIPEGVRALWTPLPTWGGIFSVQRFTRNPRFLRNINDAQLDQTEGALETIDSSASIEFFDYETKVSCSYYEDIVIDPSAVMRAFEEISDQTSPVIGSKITVHFPEIKKSVPLIWDEAAEAFIRNE